MKLDAYIPAATKRILIYGAPKTGKTVLAGGLAAKFKLTWLDLENGVNSLISNLPKEQLQNIELIKLPDTKDFPIAIETCLKLFNGTKVSICEAHGKCSCVLCKTLTTNIDVELNSFTNDQVVVLDSATQLTASCMAAIGKGKGDDWKPDWEDWRKQGAVLDRIFTQIQQAGYNIVVISHETMAEMQDGKSKIVPVAGSANFSRTFAKYFDEVVYCEMVNKKHKFASGTGYGQSILSGGRSNIKIEAEAVPSLLDFFK
jgi:hypothetical protein